MTEENRNENIKDDNNTCICQSKWFRKLLINTFGTFLGVFLALSLFAALHKPPMMGCPCHFKMMPPPMHHQFDRMEKGPRGDFHKRNMSGKYDEKAPIRVNVED